MSESPAIRVRVSPAQLDILHGIAEHYAISVSELVRSWIDQKLREKGYEPAPTLKVGRPRKT
jgi:hypothetical protein